MPVVDSLYPYVIDRPGVDPDLVLDFNESLAPPRVLSSRSRPVNRYPDDGDLRANLASYLEIAPERLLLTNGADDALERTIRCAVGPGRRAVLTTPSYGMIRRFAVLAGAEVVEVPWWDGEFPVDEVCRSMGEEGGLAAVVSPSNPTGAAVGVEAFGELVERLPRAIILLDQAYIDFADPAHDLTPIALEHPNVVVVRTFSKAWGCAGLRVGYAIADPRVIDWLQRIGLPFPISALSIEAMNSVLEEGPDAGRIAAIREQRQELSAALAGFGVEALPSEASFVFARFEDSERIWIGLGALGISVRRFAGRPGVGGWLRITLPGDRHNFERLVRGLRTVLSPQALLFDMDGVLADVSQSYRRAIVETAATWDVEITNGDVAEAKARGDATNDWDLTRRLLEARGVAVGLDEVTGRFEDLYQGTEEEPGLRRFESPRIRREILERLAARMPLGVVTGRPRADARRFLDEQNITDLFSTVVCMEDAASKPDPAPVRLALDRLGVSTAWMVGDTPDDLQAARRAGVLPIGVPASGDDLESMSTVLEAAGAARVLGDPNELEEILP
jgi:histidinol-phosphate aminotransferase